MQPYPNNTLTWSSPSFLLPPPAISRWPAGPKLWHQHPVPWGTGGPLSEPPGGCRVPSQPSHGGQPGKGENTSTPCPGVLMGLFRSHPGVLGSPPSHLTVASRAKGRTPAPRALGCWWASQGATLRITAKRINNLRCSSYYHYYY